VTVLLAIDPGPEKCGVVLLEDGKVLGAEEADLDRIRFLIQGDWERTVASVVSEDITPQKTIGNSTIETCKVIGAIREMCREPVAPFALVARVDVKRQLCGTARADDSAVKQELMRRGLIVKKGRGYNVPGKHCPQALAVGVAYLEMQKEKRT
jgi:Holliday junction resolvasome RuvABC endonuclease subunit